jgi:hypothetical protein
VRPTRRAVLLAPAALLVPRPATAAPADTYAALLAEEHAAIHLYGVLGPRLPEALRDAARAAYDDHRRHRDLLMEAVRRTGGDPEPARLTYAPPAPLGTAAQARALAVTIEDSLALRWHAAVAEVEPQARRTAAEALADEAEHLAVLRWSESRSARRAAPAFPGR